MIDETESSRQPTKSAGSAVRLWAGIGGSVVALAAVGVLDYATGSRVSVLFFYLIPVWLATQFLGRAAGIAVSFLAAGVWTVLALVGPDPVRIVIWNGGMRLALFMAFSLLADGLIRRRHELARLRSHIRWM
ncbi:MAG: hypothetical protein PHU85_19465 [Phycisphaerae bacterium]|nr:hypothetical protein [Phycisphaerae bacterium]